MLGFTFKPSYSLIISLLIATLLAGLVWPVPVIAAQTDIHGPPGSGSFGQTVTVLPNGNLIVADPSYDAGGVADVGAVYLYNGATTALISQLTGSTAGDQVGSGGVIVLPNGNYVVRSPSWDNGATANAGAVTWGSGTTGITGTISATNSLVGSTTDDRVGSYDVTVLSNGNYVVSSPDWSNTAGAVTWGSGTTGVAGTVSAANSLVGSVYGEQVGNVTALTNGNYVVSTPGWHNGAVFDTGAVTWGNGTTGITGTISAANSLMGSTDWDHVGRWGVAALPNGNYVVRSAEWDNGAAVDAGAATWGSGTTGITGTVSVANSLVGSTAYGRLGENDVIVLSNGNYVVRSSGAVTWGSGTTGITGIVSAANSLVGSTAGDFVGNYGVTALPNGNYVVRSPWWNNGAAAHAGAVTWGSGMTGITGIVSAANSLVGSTTWDYVGEDDVTVLLNGSYVVRSRQWDNGTTANAGAVTWGSGTTGITGTVSAANSLVGSTDGDVVSSGGVTALPNGNYVVSSPYWDNGASADAGAVTWGSGMTGITGTVTVTNSLVGSTTEDGVGGVTALSNGNYVVSSPLWDNGAEANAGAVTWGSGTMGVTGTVSAANSLVGSTFADGVGSGGLAALANGNYVVSSSSWNNGAVSYAGAVTWGSGTTGITGTVSAANSLVGSTADDQVGNGGVTALTNGNYVVSSYYWDNGATTNTGAVTWGSGDTGITGTVSAANSLMGSTNGDWVSWGGVTALSNGNYVVKSQDWDNGAAVNAGAVTWGSGTGGVSGSVTADNSVRGLAADGGDKMNYTYDSTNQQLVVGRPADNIVTLFTVKPGYGSSPAPGSTIHVGSANPGRSITATLTISETGNATLNVTDIQISGSHASNFHVTQTTFSIPDGGPAQSLNIVCTPSASGQRTATLTIYHNAAANPATYTLTCTGQFMNYLPLVVKNTS